MRSKAHQLMADQLLLLRLELKLRQLQTWKETLQNVKEICDAKARKNGQFFRLPREHSRFSEIDFEVVRE